MAEISKSLGEEEAIIPALPEKESNGKNYIIAIGIDNYARPKLRLESCVTDCVSMTRVLTDKYSFQVFDRIVSNEMATKKGIKAIFKKFREHAPTAEDSLVIYFSGHGHVFAIDEQIVDGKKVIKEGIGCWVTQEAAGNELDDLLKISDVIDEIRQLRILRHIMLISDCCHSGSIFENPFFYPLSNAADPTLRLDASPSRWAICSSRSNEPAIAGRAGAGSRFTEMLANQLLNNDKSQLLLNVLIGTVEEEFNKKGWQKPYAAPLNIIPNNGGQFIFKAVPDKLTITRRRKKLLAVLTQLNFNDQRKKFSQLKKSLNCVTVFSGTQNSGLKFISAQSIKQNFPSEEIEAVRASQIMFGDAAYKTLTGCFKKNIDSEEELIAAIHEKLANKHLVIELWNYAGKELMMPPKIKRETIQQLATFAAKINAAEKKHHFLLLIIDEENYPYDEMVFNAMPGVDFIPMPKIKILDVPEIDLWYGNMRLGYAPCEEECDELFGTCIYEKLEQIITDSKGQPGSTMKQICINAECTDLINNFL